MLYFCHGALNGMTMICMSYYQQNIIVLIQNQVPIEYVHAFLPDQ